jgi:tetratricopeptide (TPR) repeat protein
MKNVMVSILLILTFFCCQAFSETAVDWIKKADTLWDGKKYTNPKKAIEYLTHVIKLKPREAGAYYNRAIAYTQLGQYKRSVADYDQAIRLQPVMLQAYINRGATHLDHGNKKQGCLDAKQACRLGNCLLFDMAKTKGLCN